MSLMTPMQHFGSYLRSIRSARGISTRELARISGVSQGAICDVERGRRIAGKGILTKLAKALELDLAEVFARSGKLPDDIAQYMLAHPNAGTLLQRLVKYNFSDRSLMFIVGQVDKLYEMARIRRETKIQKIKSTTTSASTVVNDIVEQQSNDESEDNDNLDEEDDFANAESGNLN